MLRRVEGKQVKSGCGWFRNDTVYYGKVRLDGSVQARKLRGGPVRYVTRYRSQSKRGVHLDWLAKLNNVVQE